jgi:replicative DNA helicase
MSDLNYELDLALLALLRSRVMFTKWASYINFNDLSEVGKNLFKGYTRYFEEFKDVDECKPSVFLPWFFQKCHANFLSDDQEYYKNVFLMVLGITPQEIEIVIEGLRYKGLARVILNELGVINAIKSDTLLSISSFDSFKLEETLNQFNTALSNLDIEFTSNNLVDILNETDKTKPLQWRLKNLNEVLGGIKPKKFIVFAGYRNKGKTAFASSEAVYIAHQLPKDKCVLYFNNEEANEAIIDRNYLSVINIDKESPISLTDIHKHSEKAVKKYTEYLNGDINKIRIFDIRDLKDKACMQFIHKQCKKYNPGFIIIDQVDYILSEKGEEHKRPYRALYQWCRDLSCKYAPVLGLTQTKELWSKNRAGEKVLEEWVSESMLHWSNIDKQGACDILITMGFSESFDTQRNFWVHRNKGGLEDIQFRCELDRQRMCFR